MALIIFGSVMPVVGQSAPDPGRPDIISMDSLMLKPGQGFIMNLKIMADDTTFRSDQKWAGVGSFCLPLKYDAKALKLDSVKFVGAIAKWDEKFANKKIDTGFVSFAGIHNVGGDDNPVFLSPDSPTEAIKIFGHVLKDAKPGTYTFEFTIDPIQKSPYLGSIDGVNGWKPKLIPGKIVVE